MQRHRRLGNFAFLLAGMIGCEPIDVPSADDVPKRCAPTSCLAAGAGCGPIDDGCGGWLNCGECAAPATCGGAGVPFQCGCVPNCDGKCGGSDGCGGLCADSCVAPLTCGGSGVPNVCGCTPQCGGRCAGPDGCGGVCNGQCFAPFTCGGSGVPNVCGCTPQCAGKCAGPDGCGSLCAGTCAGFDTCGGGAVPYVCGCTPDCAGRCGGADGCGGQCPDVCTDYDTCGGGGTDEVCGCLASGCGTHLSAAGVSCGLFANCGAVLTCDDACGGGALCDVRSGACCTPDCAGKTCGPDGCGGSCGDCAAPMTCGGGGTAGACGGDATGLCTGDGWCPVLPFPTGADLSGAWVAPDGVLWVAGAGGFLMGRTATGWQRSELVDADLLGIKGDASRAVAFGAGGALLIYEGGAWSAADSPTTHTLRAAYADGDGGLWLAGDGGTLVWYDGADFGAAFIGAGDLRSLWGFGGGALVAGTDAGELFVTAGASSTGAGAWAALDVILPGPVTALWGTDPAALWVGVTGAGDAPGGLFFYDGIELTAAVFDTHYNELRPRAVQGIVALAGSGPDALWALGRGLDGTGDVWRWDGTSWRTERGAIDAAVSGATQVELILQGPWQGLHVASDGLTVVGAAGAMAQGTFTNGTLAGWVSLRAEPAARGSLRGVAGASGGLLWVADAARGIWHFDGAAWSAELAPAGVPRAVSARAADDVWIVGSQSDDAGRVILHRDGGGWSTVVESAGDGPLNDVWARTVTDVWMAGDGGVVLRGDGATFAPLAPSPPVAFDLVGIAGANQNAVWVVGADELWGFDGATWEQVHDHGGLLLHDVWAPVAGEVWAVGESAPGQPRVLRATGDFITGYTVDTVDLPALGGVLTLRSVWGTASDRVWVAGETRNNTVVVPVLLAFDGAQWRVETTGAALPLVAGFAAGSVAGGDLRAWVVSAEGLFGWDL